MQARQKQVLQAVHRVRDYLDAHSELLGDLNERGARATLDDVAAQIASLATRQDPTLLRAAQADGGEQARRRVVRQKWMKPLSRIARVVRISADVAELQRLRMPPTAIDAVGFVFAARGMLEATTTHKAIFIAGGMPIDFVEEFGKAIDAYELALAARDRFRGDRKGATKGLELQVSRALGVLQVIDSFVTAALEGRADLMADWNRTRRVLTRAAGKFEEVPVEQPTMPVPLGVAA